MTCYPRQSNFVTAKKLEKVGGRDAVVEAEYYVEAPFADAFFNSCKNVQMPSTGGSVLELLCGTPGGKNLLFFLFIFFSQIFLFGLKFQEI